MTEGGANKRRMTPRSWNTHAILTRAALDAGQTLLPRRRVPVVSLEDFLAKSGDSLTDFLRDHGKRVFFPNAKQVLWQAPNRIRDLSEFLKALRLNPGLRFLSVRLMHPEQAGPEIPHDASRKGPPGGMYVPTSEGEPIEVAEIIATFSDEPDWGMDQDLFAIPEYQYGLCPFPVPSGPSSQAPFHMAFFHESPILTLFMPGLRVSFMEERVRLFLNLSKLAFRAGVDYWGWRFTAWAIHYLQDLTQPYHAKPFPVSVLPLLKRFVRRPYFRNFAERHKTYLRNRHLLFEAAIHALLNDAAKKKQDHGFFDALRGKGDIPHDSLKTIMYEASKVPSALAKAVDSLLVGLLGLSNIPDPGYNVKEDLDLRVSLLLSDAAIQRPEIYRQFLKTVGRCLEDTGKVTRYALRRHEEL